MKIYQLLEVYADSNRTDPFVAVNDFLKWRKSIRQNVDNFLKHLEKLAKQRMDERNKIIDNFIQSKINQIKQDLNAARDGDGDGDPSEEYDDDEIREVFKKDINKALDQAIKNKKLDLPPEFDMYKELAMEERIIRGYDDVGIAFLTPEEDAEFCGRELPPSLLEDGFNCYNGGYNAISFSKHPYAFLAYIDADNFGVLFHEFFHSRQENIGSDSNEINHNQRYQEIENVIYSSCARMIVKLLKAGQGKPSRDIMKSNGFMDDYTHFVHTFIPRKMKNVANDYHGNPSYTKADLARAEASFKYLFAYMRAWYRGEYSANMDFPNDYWKDAKNRPKGLR